MEIERREREGGRRDLMEGDKKERGGMQKEGADGGVRKEGAYGGR